jgi:hypothetical protein
MTFSSRWKKGAGYHNVIGYDVLRAVGVHTRWPLRDLRFTCIEGNASLDTVTEFDRMHAEGILAQLPTTKPRIDYVGAFIREHRKG